MDEDKIKYTVDGRKVFIHEKFGESTFKVSYVYSRNDDDSEEEFLGDKRVILEGTLYDSPPCTVWHESIARLDKSIAAKENTLNDLTEHLSAKRKAIDEFNAGLIEKSQGIVGLETLASVLDWKITHFVMCQFEPRIVSIEDAKVKEQTIMMLSFRKKRNEFDPRFKWRVDVKGGYDYEDAIPCTSFEDAERVYAAELEKWMMRSTLGIDLIRKCIAAGLKIPVEKMQEYRRVSVKQLESAVSYIEGGRKNLDSLEKEIQEAESLFGETTQKE